MTVQTTIEHPHPLPSEAIAMHAWSFFMLVFLSYWVAYSVIKAVLLSRLHRQG